MWTLLLGLVMAVGACGEPDTDVDGGIVDASGPDAAHIPPPEIPWLAEGTPPVIPPILTPCPEGWAEVIVGDVVECEPYPAGRHDACPAGEAHFLGEPACRPIGTDCPVGDFAAELPASGSVVYVAASAPPGGDGTRGAPFDALSDVGWLGLAPGTTVALGKGTYPGAIILDPGVVVLGACVAETVLAGLAGPPAVVQVRRPGDGAALRNLTIRDVPQLGVRLEDGHSLLLSGVLVEGASAAGVYATSSGTELSLVDVVVRGSRLASGNAGYGVSVTRGAHLDATRILLVGNHTAALYTTEGATLELSDVLLADTLEDGSGVDGVGVAAYRGSAVTGSRMLVTGNHTIGLGATDEGTTMVLADVIVRGTLPRARDRVGGMGIEAGPGARIEMKRTVLADNHFAGAGTSQGGSVVMSDSVIRNTLPSAVDSDVGRGVNVGPRSSFTGERVVISDNHDIGVSAAGMESFVSLTDVVIQRTRHREIDGLTGNGVEVVDGGHLEATRLALVANSGGGLAVHGETTSATISDVLVDDAMSTGPETPARGLDINFGAQVVAQRLLVSDHFDTGIMVDFENSRLMLTDAVVRQSLNASPSGEQPRGIQAQTFGTIEGERVRVEGSVEFGVLSLGGASIDLRSASVVDVRAGVCDATGVCSEYGYAVAAVQAQVHLVDFEIRRSPFCGVLIQGIAAMSDRFGTTAMDLQSGIVANARIGACIQFADYDVGRLSDEVTYVDNGVNLDSTDLPVPALPELAAP